ncbi:MAG: hypothetical protein ACI8QG_002325, partial [Flavobacteriales bacterium]
ELEARMIFIDNDDSSNKYYAKHIKCRSQCH